MVTVSIKVNLSNAQYKERKRLLRFAPVLVGLNRDEAEILQRPRARIPSFPIVPLEGTPFAMQAEGSARAASPEPGEPLYLAVFSIPSAHV
jgi:hypothetical protein